MASSQSVLRSPGMKTPKKNQSPYSQISEVRKMSENWDPNLTVHNSCSKKSSPSPTIASAKKKKSAAKIISASAAPTENVRERKFFVVAKKKSAKIVKDSDPIKCRKAAYEALRASQENFFRSDNGIAPADRTQSSPVEEEQEEEEEQKKNIANDSGNLASEEEHSPQNLEGSSKIRKLRSLMMEQAMNSIPEAGEGRVLHLVKAFEEMLAISKDKDPDNVEDCSQKVMKWPLPGLQPPSKLDNNRESSSSVDFHFPPKDLDRESTVYTSFDNSNARFSFETKASEAGRRSRRSSSDSLRTSWNKKLRVTRQQPFKLRTEQRGRIKEDCFISKVKEMLREEEKKRIPIAQGLPYTTDEPEQLAKPPVKEATEPVDLVLHSDVRAAERAAFDNFVSERLTQAEKIKLERERQRKLEEEEEIKKLRKELVPRAQPLPYFDRPFIPKRSTRPRTVPKEPKFRVRPHRSCDRD